MGKSLIWLPTVLKSAGLKVAVVDGWETRGHGDVGTPCGVLCHHTAGGEHGNMPTLKTLIKGRCDLPGPLSQLGLGRDGTFYVIAAGKCYHAGTGMWQGITSGNTNFIGIEAENTGCASDPWPEVQLDAYARGVAAILQQIRRGPEYCAGHKEYALPPGRKPDPSFDMVDFRRRVAAIIAGTAPPPHLIPAKEGEHMTLRRGAKGELVAAVQQKLGLEADGDFGPKTEAAVRQFQRDHDLVPDGIIGPKTRLVLEGG